MGLLSKLNKRMQSIVFGAVLVLSQITPFVAFTPRVSATQSDEVTICHATNSHTSPYTTNTVNKSSVDEVNNQYLNGHGDHTGDVWYQGIADHSWGDIIPPFTNDISGTSFPGMNWTASGQAIWNNGCDIEGSIKVIKDTQPNDTKNFDFNINQEGQGLNSDFELEDDGDNSDNDKNYKVFEKLDADDYVITEDRENGWILDSITCSGATYRVDLSNRTVTLSLGVAEHAECTFVNIPEPEYGSVKVNKKVDADGDGAYEGGNTTASSIGFKWGLDSELVDNSMGSTQTNVPTGVHTVTENSFAGYKFTGWYYTGSSSKSCTNPQGTTLPVSVTVEKDRTKEITLCNQKVNPIKLRVEKFEDKDGDGAYPAGDGDVKTSTPFEFTLYKDGKKVEVKSTDANGALTFSDQDGSAVYTVCETDKSGWFNTFSSPGNVVSDPENLGRVCVEKSFKAGDQWTYVFANTRLQNIWVEKYVDTDGDGQAPNLEGEPRAKAEFKFDLYDSEDKLLNSSTTSEANNGKIQIGSNLKPGTYTVCEYDKTGWLNTFAGPGEFATDPADEDRVCVSKELESGPGWTFVFANMQPFNIWVEKYVDTDGDGQAPNLEGEPRADEDFRFVLYDKDGKSIGEGITSSENNGFVKLGENLVPGVYTVCEDEKYMWLNTFAGPGDIVSDPEDLGRVCVSRTFKSGENWTFVFANEKQQGTVVVTKFNDENKNGEWDEGEDALPNWNIQLTGLMPCYDRSDFSAYSLMSRVVEMPTLCEDVTNMHEETTDENGEATFVVDRGVYRISETLKEGWEQTGIYCDPLEEMNELELNRVSVLVLDEDEEENSVPSDLVKVYTGETRYCYVGNYEIPEEPETPGQVLSATTTPTPQVLADTGANTLINLFAGLFIVGTVGVLFRMTRAIELE